jgi:hypothetical protein
MTSLRRLAVKIHPEPVGQRRIVALRFQRRRRDQDGAQVKAKIRDLAELVSA